MDISLVKSTPLEDYIAKNKIKYAKNKSTLCADGEKTEGLNIVEDDDKETDKTIWKGPSVDTTFIDLDYEKNDFEEMFNDPELRTRTDFDRISSQTAANKDLRNKLSGTVQQRQQWRLMQPNLNTQRPADMPPMFPTDSSVSTKAMCYKNNASKKNNKNKNHYNRNLNTNNKNRFRNRNGGWNDVVAQVNNNGVQSYAQRNKREVLNQSLTNVLKRVKSNVYPRDITVECENNTNFPPNPQQTIFPMEQPTGNLTKAAGAVLNLENKGANHTEQSDDSVSVADLLGLRNNMPHWLLASKMLEYFRNCDNEPTQHKPIYDLKIQKDIHYLQKKQITYKVPGGEIVSSDGIGIDNINIKPSTTGITMNHRFS